MHIKYTFKTAITSLLSNKSRSALTILGIVIGVTAIILVVSVGKGAEGLILDQVQSFGSELVEVNPGQKPKGPSDFSEFFSDSLKQKELEALSNPNNVRGVSIIAPFVMHKDSVSYKGETFRPNIIGTTDQFEEIFDMYPETGVMFSDSDVVGRSSVVVIGSDVEEEFFNGEGAIGKKIRIGDRLFRVIGVLKKRGQMAFFNPDEMVIAPYTTVQKYLLGIDHFHSIQVKAESEEMVPIVKNDIMLTLREMHNITDPDKDDFHVNTQAEAMDTIGSITGILTALLVSVAAISLIVGGVGIMNIMLVSVTERTREIGLRKALGATRKEILKQFLLESVILTGIGGIIGIIIGFGFSVLSYIILGQVVATGWKFAFSIPAALIGIAISVLVGLVFGIYPAKEGSKKSPIEALRYE